MSYTITTLEILKNEKIFSRMISGYTVNGTRDKVYYNLRYGGFRKTTGYVDKLKISFMEVFELVEDDEVKEEMLFHLDELMKLEG